MRGCAGRLERIREIDAASRGTYGAPLIHAELGADGRRVGRNPVARLMRGAGLAGVSRRKGVRGTWRDSHARPAPDLVQRQSPGDAPDRLWARLASVLSLLSQAHGPCIIVRHKRRYLLRPEWGPIMDKRRGLDFIHAAGWILGLRIVGLLLQLAVFLLIARLHPVVEVGVYAAVNGVWLIARNLNSLGLGQTGMRFIPAFLATGEAGKARAFELGTRRVVGFVAVATGALVLAVGLGLDWAGVFEMSAAVISIAAAAIPAYAMFGLLASQLRARGGVRSALLPESIVLPMTLAALIELGAMTGTTTIVWTIFSQAASAYVVWLIYVLLDRRGEPKRPSSLPKGTWREIRATAMNIFGSHSLTILAERSPVLIVSAILGPAAAGLYEIAQRFGLLGTIVTWAAGLAAGPMYADAHARGDKGRLQSLLVVSSWTAFLPALAVFAFLIVFGQWGLGIVGSGYVDAYPAMLFLCGASLANAAGGLSSNVFYVTGFERIAFKFSGAKLVVVLLGVPLLGTFFGVAGAAASVTISSVVRDFGMSALLPRTLGIVPGLCSRHGLMNVLAWLKQPR